MQTPIQFFLRLFIDDGDMASHTSLWRARVERLLYLVTNRTPLLAHFAVDRKCRNISRAIVELGLTLGLSSNSLTAASILRCEENPFGTTDPT
jgi:hypothetical protein